MNLGYEFNQNDSQYYIKKELEEVEDNNKEEGQNEAQYYCDEPSELIDIKYIEDFSREKFFTDIQPDINENINNNNIQSNEYNELYINNNYKNKENNGISNNQSGIPKIFQISKFPRFKDKNKSEFKKFFCKDGHTRTKIRKQLIDWDNIEVPKEKHFHFDRKKHRIVFQRKHLKILYSVVGLTPPINFLKCYNMIKEQIGDKTLLNFGKGKSFHIIRENGEEKIVTLKDKKLQLKKTKFNKNSEK